ncbi:MAG: YncE family protein [Dokdonella sp.]|uniref:YncE family protein n=1 Tax=Dokdonella sp. TaxID=2291710 RepID=UPI003F811002
MHTVTPNRRPDTHRTAWKPLALACVFTLPCSPAFAAGPYAYIPSTTEHTVSVVDLSDTAATPGTITVTGTANTTLFYSAAVSRRDGMLYVADQGNETVFQINASTGATLHAYLVGSNPRGIAVDPSGKHVYVANLASSGMSIIDTAMNTVTDVDFSSLSGTRLASPSGLALNLTGTRAYVTDTSVNHRLCRINLVSPPARVADGDCVVVGEEDNDSANPVSVAVSPNGTRAYVANRSEGSVTVVNTAAMTVVRNAALGQSTLNGIAIAPSGKRAYVGNAFGSIVVLDLTRIEDVTQNPIVDVIEDDAIDAVQGVAVSPDGTRLLAVDNSNNQ